MAEKAARWADEYTHKHVITRAPLLATSYWPMHPSSKCGSFGQRTIRRWSSTLWGSTIVGSTTPSEVIFQPVSDSQTVVVQ